MSFHDYKASRDIISGDPPPFGALVMAAMRQADTYNQRLLQAAFPQLWDELDARYNAPGGLLPGDPGYREITYAGTDDRPRGGDDRPAGYEVTPKTGQMPGNWAAQAAAYRHMEAAVAGPEAGPAQYPCCRHCPLFHHFDDQHSHDEPCRDCEAEGARGRA
jgi:hypothetical protein